jgi:phosphoribosyl 1,2-cyclic phosphate phosphodiesterase
MSELRAIILGCGSSGGVPRPGGEDGRGIWGTCDPKEPKNRRLRCSLLVQRAHPEHGWGTQELTSVLVDTSPDFNAQMLNARCNRLDGVLYTHDHADQSHGIDDLRIIAMTMMRRVPVWLDEATAGSLLTRFAYCFEQQKGSPYPAILERHDMPDCGTNFEIDGPSGPIAIEPFLQHHGSVDSLGFIFGADQKIAYSSDVKALPGESLQALQNCSTWIVDALRRQEHPSHAHLDLSLEWIAQTKPERAVLTNLHIDMDYQTLCEELPAHIRPAYDGLVVYGA